jgi:hypothetical protein
MTAKTRSEISNAIPKDLSVPDFLLVKNRRPPPADWRPPVSSDDVALATDPRLKQLTTEARAIFEDRLRKGTARMHWLDDPATSRLFERLASEKTEKTAARQAALAELRERAPKKINPLKGLVPLRDILVRMGDAAPKRRHAQAAIDASSMIHTRYHFADAPVTLAHVERVIREYVPPVSRAGGQKADEALFDPAHVIVVRAKKNPRREGTAAHERMVLLMAHHKMTVAVFLGDGGNPTTLKNAVAKQWAEVKADTHENVATAKKRSKK